MGTGHPSKLQNSGALQLEKDITVEGTHAGKMEKRSPTELAGSGWETGARACWEGLASPFRSLDFIVEVIKFTIEWMISFIPLPRSGDPHPLPSMLHLPYVLGCQKANNLAPHSENMQPMSNYKIKDIYIHIFMPSTMAGLGDGLSTYQHWTVGLLKYLLDGKCR